MYMQHHLLEGWNDLTLVPGLDLCEQKKIRSTDGHQSQFCRPDHPRTDWILLLAL